MVYCHDGYQHHRIGKGSRPSLIEAWHVVGNIDELSTLKRYTGHIVLVVRNPGGVCVLLPRTWTIKMATSWIRCDLLQSHIDNPAKLVLGEPPLVAWLDGGWCSKNGETSTQDLTDGPMQPVDRDCSNCSSEFGWVYDSMFIHWKQSRQ